MKAAVSTYPSTALLVAGIDLGERRFAAAALREAMTQTGTWKIDSDFPKVIDATELEAIADNLHSPPPQPPKLEELDQAVRELEGWNGGMEIRTSDWIRERIGTIRRGINYHCKH